MFNFWWRGCGIFFLGGGRLWVGVGGLEMGEGREGFFWGRVNMV